MRRVSAAGHVLVSIRPDVSVALHIFPNTIARREVAPMAHMSPVLSRRCRMQLPDPGKGRRRIGPEKMHCPKKKADDMRLVK